MYKLSSKKNGKWWNWGKVDKNKFGNMQASFKVTPEFKEMISSIEDNGWLNLAAFPMDQEPQPEVPAGYDKLPLNDEVPF